jgi:transcriptional regulator with XRE-family HTH domain
MTTPKTIDFSKVEILRQRLGLSTTDMAMAMSVSRMTYYLWVRGGNMRSAQALRARKVIKVLLDLTKDSLWFEEVIPKGPAVRRERLLALIN